MIELIKIVREKALSDILYAQARVSVCDELLEMAEVEEHKKAQVCFPEDVPTLNSDVVETVEEEEKPGDTVLFDMGV